MNTASRTLAAVLFLAAMTPAAASADQAAPASAVEAKPTEAQPAPKAPPPPYSLPWQLRPLTVGNVLRSDTSFAFYEAGDETGTTVATTLLGSYKLTAHLAPVVRFAFVANEPPAAGMAPPSGTALVNPLAGALYANQVSAFRWSAFAGATLPIGMGGGDSPDKGAQEAASRGNPARSAMDGAMFATNYFALIAGGGVGYVGHGVTAQAEATLVQFFRARGPEAQDARRTNFTAGLHLGYFLLPQLSIGGELRYQRWLSDAAAVRANDAARESVTFAIGPRLNLKLAPKLAIRPGLSYSRALDAPFSKSSYQMVQVDVPFIF